ncbi:DUF3375 domain-containing protein [Botrimarina mediterranea]|uniref:DUF3375 domain-containing protein n=1 Tax=Botrimarina mediterranea TaxID=2528022 RepID=A0A518K7E0_9BACT|nr:DUF3375 domain-containing protein [Botrimarina mediterranea]QDV73710.1 hypothetical protein Spa11_19090 [Botrimarina mediterranea]QDV78300.1 hypothetical protein K2D_19070 [Planctomycetes bacterium K2D]
MNVTRLADLRVFFDSSPAVRLLRAGNAPYVVAFLDEHFKQAGRVGSPFSEAHAALADFQRELHEQDSQLLPGVARDYLTDWCSPETHWLERRMEAGSGEWVLQLSPHAEQVLLFLQRSRDRELGFVATESRLRMILDALCDLAADASQSPEERLAHLQEQRQRLEEKISQVEENGDLPTLGPRQVRERLASAVGLIRELLSDFRSVEESFREITRGVQQREAGRRLSRGGILEFVLDSEDELREQDQGKSFYEFYRLLVLSPAEQDRLRNAVEKLAALEDLASMPDALETVRRLEDQLIAEAEQVMATNRRLSSTLRRVLDTRAREERRRVAELLTELRGLGVRLASEPPTQAEGLLSSASVAAIDSPFRRPFWSAPQCFDRITLTPAEIDEASRRDAIEQLAALERIDWRGMREHLRRVVSDLGYATLADVVERRPVEAGVVELLGYLRLAKEEGHTIDTSQTQEIAVRGRGVESEKVVVSVPLVTFQSS